MVMGRFVFLIFHSVASFSFHFFVLSLHILSHHPFYGQWTERGRCSVGYKGNLCARAYWDALANVSGATARLKEAQDRILEVLDGSWSN